MTINIKIQSKTPQTKHYVVRSSMVTAALLHVMPVTCKQLNRFALNWKNLATPLGIILGKSLKRTSYDNNKPRITKFLCVIFFHIKALSCIP